MSEQKSTGTTSIDDLAKTKGVELKEEELQCAGGYLRFDFQLVAVKTISGGSDTQPPAQK
jgi:hypothetical protein